MIGRVTLLIRTIICSLLIAVCSGVGATTIVFDNFGAGNSYTENLGLGIGAIPGGEQDFANAFVPSQSGFLSDIWLAVGLSQGSNELDVFLMDGGAQPSNNILETFHFVDMMGPFGSINPLLHSEASGNTFLTAGVQYWLVASMTDPTAHAAWNINNINDTGAVAWRQNSGAWTISSSTRGAFRVAIPEPANISLIFLGLVGLTFVQRYRKRLANNTVT